ncbi:hypothetical protein CASFOL_030196 [Castilleja foliolosa]|uniref:Kinesin motor domain-containing protein n=1 Tax=Castilleja foliolosa TaxID=1961234 RepID=A0ABD3CAP6_9LAMI
MSKDTSLTRPSYRKTPANENEFETLCNQIPSASSRAPLISITDPSQCQSKISIQNDFKELAESSSKAPATKKSDGVSETQLISSLLLKTPKLYGRNKPANSEPNSAQTTPIRTGPRLSIASAASGCTISRLPPNGGGKGSIFPRVCRGISTSSPQLLSVDVPHIELDDDPSFWKDHNVQVLIRIRPLNSCEMVSQEYGRCLIQESSQTLVWLGHPETRFTFDHIACDSISQEKLFRVAGLPMVDNCMSGYNSCMFAYGQTGSGKTYTMMGEIDKMDGKLSDDCGITPRVFEYLFTRITQEEESRKNERLTYSCKCSFLEIYNEQITDLLEPSSTNLQLREDSKKGVYVENLTEHSVRTVNNVLELLQQGAANRKIAATHMNSESSRSHSVFTCTVESRWEKDSVAHLRFGRLNLVDLAGSERQKSSGAEGDRLKEAANINKSLSTLGLVIMSLVDLAQGKHRHVPYRDSRLTFLLQDSLGGNSKTTIIANVSPSICSANETLSTLKFAQRAKLIQNNAKINEDASGGVIALQQQIQQLKDQLSLLMKSQHTSMELIDFVPRLEQASSGRFSESYESSEEFCMYDEHTSPKGVVMKNVSEATLHGVLQRAKLAETEVRRLKAENEHLNHLVHQKERETQHSTMMLKFHEEKIKRLELLSGGLVSSGDEVIYDKNDDKMDTDRQLMDAQCLIDNMKLERLQLIEELEAVQSENQHLTRMLCTMEVELGKIKDQNVDYKKIQSGSGTNTVALQTRMEKLSKDLKEAKILNRRYMEDHETRLSQDHQTELVRSEAEMETTRTIIQLQEEIDRLQSEFQECLCSLAEQNLSLRNSVAAKEDELRESCTLWERATLELTTFLTNGSRSLRDVSREIKSISSSFPYVSDWISEQVERAAKKCVEKEETILLLQKSLEDAQNTMMQMEQKFFFLKSATIAMTEFHQPEKSSSESIGEEEFPGNEEDLICKAMQNDISTFVLQCQMGELAHKVRTLNTISNTDWPTFQEHCLVADDLLLCHVSQDEDEDSTLQPVKSESKGHQVADLSTSKDLDLFDGDSVDRNSELVRELTRRDVLLKGLLFDFSLLQEFASHRKDIKDELEKLIAAMTKVQNELQIKTVQLDDALIQNTELEDCLSEAEKASFDSKSELNQAKGALNILSEQNDELKDLLKNLYLKNSEAEQIVEDQKEAIKSLETEIIRVSSSREKESGSSVDDVEDALEEVVAERDQLVEKLTSLQDKLDMVSAIADENQAIAAEARQESEASKLYAEQKEEEVAVLERSVQELESTINVLEKKVHEMEVEVEKHGRIRDSLESELHSLRHRLLTVEDITESMNSENSSTALSEDYHSRSLEIKKAASQIRFLEEENEKQAKEIRQYKDYISELVLHADAQASQYQHKYKTLEAMVREVKTDISNLSTAPTLDRSDKVSARTRGSSSPFKCIAGLVHQMNQEKEHELSSARLRIEELEALAASRYKEVCMLNTRLASTESMTHDVIRDLLSVKLDISNYANIVDHHQLQKLIEEAQHHRQDVYEMEQEILFMRSQIEDLLEDKERCISEINRSKSDHLTTEIALEQMQERDRMLIAQNDMLKMDKHNLQKRVTELDDMVKKLFGMQDSKPRSQPQTSPSLRRFNYDLSERLSNPQRVQSRINNQHGQHRRPDAPARTRE